MSQIQKLKYRARCTKTPVCRCSPTRRRREMIATQPNLVFIVAPETPDVDLSLYRLLRSNALWFASATDGYSISPKSGNIDIPKGWCVTCSKNFYRQCVALYPQVSARVAKHSRNGMASTSSVSDVAISHVSENCLCPQCLKAELRKRFALRVDQVEVFFGEDDNVWL